MKGKPGQHIRAAQLCSVDEENRRIEAVASTEAVDSFGTILRANWDLSRFNANPVLLFVHDDCKMPVGHCENVRVEGTALLFTACFDDVTQLDHEVWEKYRRKTMRGFSVRFNPLETNHIEQNGRQLIEYARSELMEISCVPLPSNPEALRRSAAQRQRNHGDHMNKSEMLKALRAIIDGSGDDDDTKKKAQALYDVLGGDEALKESSDAESSEEGGDGEARGEGEDSPGYDEGRAEGEGDEPAPKSDRAPGKRASKPLDPSMRATLDMAKRMAALEAKDQRRAVSDLVRSHHDRFTPATRAWALDQSEAVVRSYLKAAPKANARTPQPAPATRGAGQGEQTRGAGSPDILTGRAAAAIDNVLGIMPARSGAPGFSAVDPATGVRRLNAMTPSEARAAQKGS